MMYSEKVNNIIDANRRTLEKAANEFVKGNKDIANKLMYQLFMDNGYYSDCEDTYQLLNYVGEFVNLINKQGVEIWRQIPTHPEYECTIEGDVRRIDNKHVLKISDNGRYKITKDGKTVTLRLIDLVYPTWYANNNKDEKDDDMEYLNLTSDIEDDIHFTGNLVKSGTTEQNI